MTERDRNLRKRVIERTLQKGEALYGSKCMICELCMQKAAKKALSCHHVVPLKNNGKDVPENVIAIGRKCEDKLHGNTQLLRALISRVAALPLLKYNPEGYQIRGFKCQYTQNEMERLIVEENQAAAQLKEEKRQKKKFSFFRR